jgi:hypothetical protein
MYPKLYVLSFRQNNLVQQTVIFSKKKRKEKIEKIKMLRIWISLIFIPTFCKTRSLHLPIVSKIHCFHCIVIDWYNSGDDMYSDTTDEIPKLIRHASTR